MAVQRKQVLVNVYAPGTNTLIATWKDITFEGFIKELNAGPSECVLTLGKKFDYSSTDLFLGNEVEIRIADKDTVAQVSGHATRIIYRGYISLIERSAGRDERVTVRLLGFYTLLSLDVLKSGAQTTLYSHNTDGLTVTVGSQGAADIGLMARTILARYIAENPTTKITCDPDQSPNTGTTATYSFQQKTYREAIDALLEMAPAGTFYYIDENGRFYFKSKPSTATHKFVFGKHFSDVRVEHSAEKVRNVVLVWNGQTDGSKVYTHYEDAESIARYGRRVLIVKDFGINNSNAADLLGARLLAENKDPDVKITCAIIDNNGDDVNGYDIESIQPGDTCSFFGFSPGFDTIFRENMLITRVRYTLDRVELEVELFKTGVIDVQTRQGRKIDDIASGGLGVPESYS